MYTGTLWVSLGYFRRVNLNLTEIVQLFLYIFSIMDKTAVKKTLSHLGSSLFMEASEGGEDLVK